MPMQGGVHEMYADIKRDRRAVGLRVFDDSGPDNRLVPLAEAAHSSDGDVVQFTEAATPSDFPNALGNALYKRIIKTALEKRPKEQWRNIFAVIPVVDFRPSNQIIPSELDDLLPILTNSEYKDQTMTDAAFAIQVAVYGRLFKVNRETIINDNIGLLNNMADRMGRSVSRTLNKFFIRTILEGSPTATTAYDGVNVFNAATHNNLLSGASSVLSLTSLQTAFYQMETNVGDANLNPQGGPIEVDATTLYVPPALRPTAFSVLNSALIVAAGAQATTDVRGNANPLQNLVNPVVDRWLTSTTAWYLFADPNDAPAFAAAFLRGRENPDLLVERPYMTRMVGGGGGGDDPFEVDFDVLTYKVRHQYGAAGGVPWAGLKSAGV